MVAVHFLLQSKGGTGEFMYKGLVLGNKQLLSNMIYRGNSGNSKMHSEHTYFGA